MSIISAIKEVQHDNNNLEDLAKLPQYLIMNMVQRGEIKEYMLTPILGKKAEMADQAAKMQAAEQLAAQGGALPTVLEQNMGKIAQAENPAPPMPQQQMQQPMPQQMAQAPMPQGPEDVGIASQATQPMSMAGGGIIAFDDGGDVDSGDDYQEMQDDAHEAAMNSKLYEMIAGLKGGHGVGITAGNRGAERGVEHKGDLESRLRAAIMQRESAGKRYDKNGNLLTSSKGALGEMQVMPATARDPGFGIKPAKNANDPNELGRVGNEYVGALFNKYQDPKLTMIAYNMGPGKTDKWLAAGADPRKLPKETQQYIRGVSLAQGGEVKHYAAGDYVDDTQYDPFTGMVVSGADTYIPRPTEREVPSDFFMDAPWQRKAAKEANKKAASTKPAPAKNTPAPAQTTEIAPPQIGAPKEEVGIKAAQDKADDEHFNLMKYIKNREAKMDAAEKRDFAMAGLAAGLGMIGGESQHFGVNVGKGGQMGVQQLANSQKLRASQEAALGKLYGSAAQTELMGKMRKDTLNENTRQANEKLALASSDKLNGAIQKALGANKTNLQMLDILESQVGDPSKPLSPEQLAKLKNLREWKANTENAVRRNFATSGGGGGYTPTQSQAAALNRYSS